MFNESALTGTIMGSRRCEFMEKAFGGCNQCKAAEQFCSAASCFMYGLFQQLTISAVRDCRHWMAWHHREIRRHVTACRHWMVCRLHARVVCHLHAKVYHCLGGDTHDPGDCLVDCHGQGDSRDDSGLL
jgi:hypothetical protein